MNRFPLLTVLAAGLAACGTSALAQNAETVLAGVRHTVFTVIASGSEHGVVNVLGHGSAVLVAPGRLITSCSVVDNASGIAVSRREDRIVEKVRLTNRDPSTGLCELAPLQAKAGFDRPVVIASADSLRPGAVVYTVGSPDGMALRAESGSVSALREAATGQRFVLISTPLTPGLRGAGLFDESGRLMGIVSAAATKAQTPGFAVAAQSIRTTAAPAADATPPAPTPPRTAARAAAAPPQTAAAPPTPPTAPAAPASQPRQAPRDLSARLAGSGDDGRVQRRYRELVARGELADLEDDEAIARVYATLINDEIIAQMRWDEGGDHVAEFEVRLHRSGEIMFVLPLRRSGLERFDLAAQRAIGVASPFPVPRDDAAFAKMQSVVLAVRPPKPTAQTPPPARRPGAPAPK